MIQLNWLPKEELTPEHGEIYVAIRKKGGGFYEPFLVKWYENLNLYLDDEQQDKVDREIELSDLDYKNANSIDYLAEFEINLPNQ